jgi:hypothetical protein
MNMFIAMLTFYPSDSSIPKEDPKLPGSSSSIHAPKNMLGNGPSDIQSVYVDPIFATLDARDL